MPKRDTVVIGGSAGSLEHLRHVLADLPPDFPAAVFVVLHLNPHAPDLLTGILERAGALPVVEAKDGQMIEPGKIYPAPPDRHLIIAEDHVHLTRGPREGLHRPSINITFRSAATTHGEQVIGVLLSGMLDDGASGLWDIAKHQGVTIVQDPDEAPFPSMPLSALRDVPVNYSLRAAEIGPLLRQLVSGSEIASVRKGALKNNSSDNRFLGFTCPECHRPLYERRTKPAEFQCRVGHMFSLQALIEQSTSMQEQKLYEGMVALEEGADLAAYAATKLGGEDAAALLEEVGRLRQQVGIIRQLIEDRNVPAIKGE